MAADLAVIVTARNEADRLGATLRALRAAFPDAVLWVADDASEDGDSRVTKLALPRSASLPTALPTSPASPSASRRSSTIW